MTSLTEQVTSLAIRLAEEFKSVYSGVGDLESLKTDSKTSLVDAINEVKTNPVKGVIDDFRKTTWSTYSSSRIDVLLSGKTFTPINDVTPSNLSVYSSSKVNSLLQDTKSQDIKDTATETQTTWSSQKITDFVGQRVESVLGGAGSAFDTLRELQDALGRDENFSTTILSRLDKVIRADVTQNLTEEEQARARANLGGVGVGGGGMSTPELRLDVDGALYWHPIDTDQEIFLDEDGVPYWGATPGIFSDDPFYVTEFSLPSYLSEPGTVRDILDGRITSLAGAIARGEVTQWKENTADSLYETKANANLVRDSVSALSSSLGAKSNVGHSHTTGEIGAIARSGQAVTVWAGTQSEYDSIASKDATTLYFIAG